MKRRVLAVANNITNIRKFRIKHVASKHDSLRIADALMAVEDMNQHIERVYQSQIKQEKKVTEKSAKQVFDLMMGSPIEQLDSLIDGLNINENSVSQFIRGQSDCKEGVSHKNASASYTRGYAAQDQLDQMNTERTSGEDR